MAAPRSYLAAFALALALDLALTYLLGQDTLSVAPVMSRRILLVATISALFVILFVLGRRLPPSGDIAALPPASPAMAALLAGGAFSVTLLIGAGLLRSVPLSGDEGAYVLQGRMLAEGRVSIALTPVQQYIELYYLFPVQDRVISQYAPGWAAVLAAFAKLHIPLVLANPLLGAASVLALCQLGKERHGGAVATLAAALMVLSAFFLLNAASFYNHTEVGLFGILFVLGATRFIDRPAIGSALLTGIGFSVVASVRHYDALLLAVPVAVTFLWRFRARHWARVPVMLLAAIPLLALTLWYYRAATGQWFVIPQTLRDPNDGLLGAYWSAAKSNGILARRFLELAEWTSPGFVALLVAALIGKWRSRSLRFHDFYPLVFLAGYWLFWSDGIYGWGPRYIYPALPFMALTIASWACAAANTGGQTLRLMVAACLIAGGLQSVPIALRGGEMVAQAREMHAAVARAGLHNAIVMIGTWTGRVRLTPPGDLARNGLRLDGDVIYAHAPGLTITRDRPPGLEAAAAAMKAYQPGRSVWLYVRNPGDETGHLEEWK